MTINKISATLTLLALASASLLTLSSSRSAALAQPQAVATSSQTMTNPATTLAHTSIVTASGSATVQRTPDNAVVTLGSTVIESQSALAQDRLNQQIEKITLAIKALNIQGLELQTAWVNLNPVYDYNNQSRTGEPKITGYSASTTLRVSTPDIKAVGKILDAGITAGANNVQGISFELKNDADARREALGNATKDARAKANAIASALDLKIHKVIEATTGEPRTRPVFMEAKAMPLMARSAGGDMAPTQIEAGMVTISADVTVSFSAY